MLLYFSPGAILGHIASPIIKKLFGEAYMHYPMFLLILPRIEFVFVEKLQNPEKAVEIYESIVRRMKDRKLARLVGRRIEELKR